jgi:hypothetical protein
MTGGQTGRWYAARNGKLVYGRGLLHANFYSFKSFKWFKTFKPFFSIRRIGRFELLERFDRLEPFELFLPRLPELQDPFLRFFLARTEFGVGIREPILDTRSAALLRHHLTERDIIAE